MVSHDLIADILSRLPVKHLLCLRSVSKLWRSLIDDPDFISLHLSRSLRTRTNHTLILKNTDLHAADLSSLVPLSKLEHPLMSYNHGVEILGSCNGLLCIRNIVEDMAIWNPSTRKYQVLPYLGSCKGYVSGFGHDPIKDDYKVVKIIQLDRADADKPLETEVKVCSLKRNRWRKIQDLPCVSSFPSANGVFAGGALHWVLTQKVDLLVKNMIIALDLAAESFNEVPQPEYADDIFQSNIGVLGGCLCVVANHGDARVDLWVMKEYGVKESWTILFSLAREDVIGPLRFLKPLAYSRSGNQVLLEHDNINLFWYDMVKHKSDDVWVPGMPPSYETEVCLQSLVSLNVDKRQQNEDDNGDIKKMDDFLSKGFKLVL
ncbi:CONSTITUTIVE EXPRESSER OF PR GENES 1, CONSTITUTIVE EXPRESSER OF PR GENES 30 [Hibiscus trionum]|uniref:CONSTITUTIVE EXPRESSER OF PR GENES 1, CONSTITUTIVE EXPRESSER OF PR GENES 30 n=1 Tax=Hibiscus trionum TaxID=183268 RepID=A0A9W7MQX3_HIBTR|nr:CONSTITUTIVE EXPRESSER OF PR GENES 1, CONSTITUTIVE EXPRESSER OF PR GENES 30 [Hibiscus trionum]